jgi:hypothetical protein
MPLMMSIGRKGIRMRRFRILAWVAVSLAAWCGSAARASAQTYDFTFSGGGVSIPDGMLPHSGGNVTSVSGTLSGVSPGKDNGALSLLFTVPPSIYNSSTDYTISFEAGTPAGGEDFVSFNGPGGGASEIEPDGFSADVGTSTVTAATPGPHPRLRPALLPRVRPWRPVHRAQAAVAGGAEDCVVIGSWI